MDCKIILKSCTESWSQQVKSRGTLNESDGVYTVDYTIDGDDCRIIASEDEVFQKRTGNMSVSVHFKRGEETLCTVGTGGLSGSYKIVTEQIKITRKRGGLGLTLVYLGGEGERITLNFGAIVSANRSTK